MKCVKGKLYKVKEGKNYFLCLGITDISGKEIRKGFLNRRGEISWFYFPENILEEVL